MIYIYTHPYTTEPELNDLMMLERSSARVVHKNHDWIMNNKNPPDTRIIDPDSDEWVKLFEAAQDQCVKYRTQQGDHTNENWKKNMNWKPALLAKGDQGLQIAQIRGYPGVGIRPSGGRGP